MTEFPLPLPSLAPAEQRVGQLVLADPHSFARLPVRELAAKANVSKPTVVRFCRSMGYDGLADFKLKLAGNVAEGVPFVHRSVDVDDKTADVMVKVIDNSVAAFLQYRNDANPAAIEQAANAIVNAWQHKKRLEIYRRRQLRRRGARCAAQILSLRYQQPSHQ